jgi:hypothetical protein
MPSALRWVLVAVLVLCVLGMLGWARGTRHHHGSDVDERAAPVTVTRLLAA